MRYTPITPVEPRHQQELDAIIDQATAQLYAGRWLIRLSRFPSFADHEVVGIQTIRREQRITHRTWHRTVDLDKFRNPMERLRHPPAGSLTPTITERTAPATAEHQVEILEIFASLTLPICVHNAASVLDGTACEVHIHTHSASTTLRWNRLAPPDDWRALSAAFDQAWERLCHITST